MTSSRITPALWAVQFVGVIAAAGAAVIDIETILASGPLVCLGALPVGWAAFRSGKPIGFYLALATPTMAMLCFVLIHQNRWSPGSAQLPIATLVVIYAAIHSALVPLAMREDQTTHSRRKLNLRFSVRFLLGLTLVASVMLVFLRWGLRTGETLAIVIGYTAAFGWIVMQFRRGRAATALPLAPDSVAPASPWDDAALAARTTHKSPEGLGSEIK